MENKESFSAFVVKPDRTVTEFPVSTGMLTEPERQIIADGCLIIIIVTARSSPSISADSHDDSWTETGAGRYLSVPRLF